MCVGLRGGGEGAVLRVNNHARRGAPCTLLRKEGVPEHPSHPKYFSAQRMLNTYILRDRIKKTMTR